MVHRHAMIGYWGVNVNSQRDGVIVLTGSEEDQVRAVLTVDQAELMVYALQEQIKVLKNLKSN